MAEKKLRKLHYDLLRILAAFSVVMLHSAAQFWYDLDRQSTAWLVANSYDALFRFGVPVFVMLSGALFLAPDYRLDVRRLYKHNILRMILLYIVWSCAYGIFDSRLFDFNEAGIKEVLREMMFGRYHLWFLPMIVGIYLLLPVLKSWIEQAEKKNVQYFLLLFLVLQIGRETIRALTVTEEIHHILDLGKIEMACGYIGYFVWGYYLAHVGISEKIRKVFYYAFVPSVALNVILGNVLARKSDAFGGIIYDSYGLFTFVTVTVLFLIAKEQGSKLSFGEKSSRLICEISADTLGVYVMHVGLMEYLMNRGIHSMMLPNIVGIPLFSVFCFFVCTIAAAILRRIPFIGRFLC